MFGGWSMTYGLISFRALLVWSMAFWLGGFTFYSAVVIPILHDQLGGALEAGLVTQRVTDFLNYLGLLVITLGWASVLAELGWQLPLKANSAAGLLLLAATSACLFFLLWLHVSLDRMLEMDSFSGFYESHRIYLWVSAIQWLANLGLMASWAQVWGAADVGCRPAECSSSQATKPA